MKVSENSISYTYNECVCIKFIKIYKSPYVWSAFSHNFFLNKASKFKILNMYTKITWLFMMLRHLFANNATILQVNFALLAHAAIIIVSVLILSYNREVNAEEYHSSISIENRTKMTENKLKFPLFLLQWGDSKFSRIFLFFTYVILG